MVRREDPRSGLTRRSFLIAVGGAGLAACTSAVQTPPATTVPASAAGTSAVTKAVTKVPPGSKLTAATVSTSWTVRAVPLVAAAKGYWQEQGLEVATPVVGPGNAHMAAWIGGHIDFSLNINTDLVVRSNAQGEKLYAAAGSSNKINYVLFGAANVKSWNDLKGKTVAVEGPASSSEYLVRDLAAKHNLVPGKDFQFVTIAGTVSEREQAVIGGAAGAALGTGSDWPTLRLKGLNKLGDLSEVYPNFQQAIIGARGEVLDKQPEASIAFLKGIVRSFQFLQDPKNDKEVLELLKSKEQLSVDESQWSELMSIQRPLWPANGGLNMSGLELVVKREQEAKRLPDTYDWRQFVRDQALKQAQKELGIA